MKSGISAYIPCYNNASTIEASIQSLLQQTIKIDEIFVIDDGSTDDSRLRVSQLKIPLLVHSQNQGRGAVRARAMVQAQHPLVLCCDATNTLPVSFLEQALPWFEDKNVAAVFGPFTQLPPQTLAERWRGRHLFKLDAVHGVNRQALLTTAGAMVRQEAVLKVGNYNPALRHSEDRDLGERLLAAQYAVVFDPDLKVLSIATNTLAQVLERYWRWHAGRDEATSAKAYLKQMVYSVKVMARQDLLARDLGSALISLFSPHYQFWKSWWRAQSSARRPKKSHGNY